MLFCVIMLIPEIVNRRSIRRFLSGPLPEGLLQEICEAARLAPTARNQQDWRLLIVDDPGQITRLVEAASPHQPFLKEAPVILAACATRPDYVMRCGHPAFLIDLAIVLDHVTLQAQRLGLGTCWIGSFSEAMARDVLEVPEPFRIVQLMPIGFPAENPAARSRKPLSSLIGRNRW